MPNHPRFQIMVSDAPETQGQFYWHLLAANNRIIAWPAETYVNHADCANQLATIRATAISIPVEDLVSGQTYL